MGFLTRKFSQSLILITGTCYYPKHSFGWNVSAEQSERWWISEDFWGELCVPKLQFYIDCTSIQHSVKNFVGVVLVFEMERAFGGGFSFLAFKIDIAFGGGLGRERGQRISIDQPYHSSSTLSHHFFKVIAIINVKEFETIQ